MARNGGIMKNPKAPAMTMESVARSIGSRVEMAVRTASEVADEIALAAKKASLKFPKKSARKKLTARAKKLVSAASRLKTAARKLIRSAKPAK
jgi:hypothetical protein